MYYKRLRRTQPFKKISGLNKINTNLYLFNLSDFNEYRKLIMSLFGAGFCWTDESLFTFFVALRTGS